VLEIRPDSIPVEQRKKSSRIARLTSKDPRPNIVVFRGLPEERHSTCEWQLAIKPLLTPTSCSPLSPKTPTSFESEKDIMSGSDALRPQFFGLATPNLSLG
jgi:hypothetical protein